MSNQLHSDGITALRSSSLPLPRWPAFSFVLVLLLLGSGLVLAAQAARPLPSHAALRPATLGTSLASAKAYIDALTIDSTVNVPTTVVENTALFFSWDNEKRAAPAKPYLYEWSYYNGVVFEGTRYVYEATGTAAYNNYTNAYLDAMVTDGALNSYAGYVSYHGLDCYKTASLLRDFNNSEYDQVAATLYNDLTVTNAQYAPSSLGYNYWHSWISGAAPTYKVWLDGIYMGQPFMAEYAAQIGDTAQLDKVATRLDWVHDNLRNSSTGLYYHAANSSTSYVNYHWLRAIGWYAMAQVDVMPYLSGANLTLTTANFKDFVDGMLPYQDATTGMWRNLVNVAQSDGNRYETSGTAMMAYAILKAVRNGWLADPSGTYTAAALTAFEGIVNNKLVDGNLIDIYFKASATGSNNYTTASYYYSNEGKGVGPFIMAYAEAVRLSASATPTPTPTATSTPTATPIPSNERLYASTISSGSIDGVSYEGADILLWDGPARTWSMVFDASDVGLTTNLDAFEILDDGSILMSVNAATSIPGAGDVADSDLVRFVPTSLGETTAGTFELYFDGFDVGLDASGEDIDVLARLPDGRLVMSFLGDWSAPGASGLDEDMAVFTPTSLGPETAGEWAMYFDGSDVRMTSRAENASGAWIDPATGDIYLTTAGTFSVDGASGYGGDIFICEPASLGAATVCAFAPYWDSSLHGVGDQVMDAISIAIP